VSQFPNTAKEQAVRQEWDERNGGAPRSVHKIAFFVQWIALRRQFVAFKA
jgi:hypothetical protein